MVAWITIAKTVLKENDKNKLLIILVGCLIASNYYWYERDDKIMVELMKKDSKYHELQAVHFSDNIRNTNMVNDLNARFQEHLEMDVEDQKKFNEEYQKLSEENKRLYDHVQKMLKR